MILTELMDTSLDRFYSKAFELKLTLPDVFYSRVSESVLNGLSYMKKLKLLHRDIKPSNILLNANGDIKVCDFGISGFTTDSICRTFKGCQCYMAVMNEILFSFQKLLNKFNFFFYFFLKINSQKKFGSLIKATQSSRTSGVLESH